MMKAITFSLLMALVALSFVRPAHPTSMTMYISFKGSKQGQLKGETKGKGGREKEGWFQIQSIDLAHKPVVITKETDGSSPQLLQAHYTNEVFESIVIQTVDDQNKVSKTITLTNAVISDLKKNGTIESISFGYEKSESQ